MSTREIAPIYNPDIVTDYKRVTREKAEAGKLCRVLCEGVFDLFHS